ncbi:MAG: sensor histidine kinase [Ramlibacter sp.]
MKLPLPRPGLASFGRRALVRGVFLLLALATLALAVVLLQDEKERSYRSYQQGFRRTQAELMARLREPASLLALMNPREGGEVVPLRPMVLPYPALDFDDAARAQQAVDMAGCSVRYPDGSTLCVAVGHNAYTGGFLYLVGSFRAGDLALREPGVLDLEGVHRARIQLEMRGEVKAWVAPFERVSLRGEPLLRGRLTGFVHTGEPALAPDARPLRDFRGSFWQSATCAEGSEQLDCPRRVSYSIRLPVEAFREALFERPRNEWPPSDLDRIRVHLQMLAPHGGEPLFDSNAEGAVAPASLVAIARALQPGEVLTITREDVPRATPLVLRGGAAADRSSPLILRLIDRLPVATPVAPMLARETITTPLGSFDVRLASDARGIDRSLGVIATRMAWYVAAMLAAIALAWLVIELGLLRRIVVLTRRAAAVSHNVQQEGAAGIGALDVSDLRGRDELGILAGGLADLLERVKGDVQREELRARQERDMLQAVGHEILSPLQSLMVLHPDPQDPAHRYVQRMQQAVRVLYGQATPSEALAAAQLQLAPLDLDAFLHEVAQNAGYAGIEGVRYAPRGAPLVVRADAFPLEDVLTHILRNAQRHRTPGTPITLTLQVLGGRAVVGIHNSGPAIAPDLLERIFEYGVSSDAQALPERRGQGLFVARTYMAKMGGTVEAHNRDGGVLFELAFPLDSV